MAPGLKTQTCALPAVLLLCFVPLCELVASGELADAAYQLDSPLPLTKQKSVRCYEENVKRNDGRNFEIEKIRKKEDLIETLQQRKSRDTKCVVVTSVTDDDSAVDDKIKEYTSPDGGADMDLSMPHNAPDSRFQTDTHHGIPHNGGFDDVYGDLNVNFQTTPNLDIPSIESDSHNIRDSATLDVSSHNNDLHQTSLPSGFGNLKDLNDFRSGEAVDAGQKVKTYEFATNIRRQESYDHHGFHQERVGAPGGGGWKTTYNYETSANDVDQKISRASNRGRALRQAAILILLPVLALLQ